MKDLEQRVEEMEKRIERIEESLDSIMNQLQPFISKKESRNETLSTVASSRSLQEAAEKLEMEVANLESILGDIPRLYGEKWSVAAARHLRGDSVVDSFDYSALEGKLDAILSAMKRGVKLRAAAKKLNVPYQVLGRYLQRHGYDISGNYIGMPEFTIIS